MKLIEALERFLNTNYTEQTRDTYAKFLRRFVAAIGPERPLELISSDDIDAYVGEMHRVKIKYADHTRRPPVKEPLSASTIYNRVKMIKTFFTWCVERQFLTKSPAAHLKNSRPVLPIKRKKAATNKELETVLAACRFKPRDRALVLLLAESGCRAGEASTLRISDLDLVDFTAYVVGKGNIERQIYFFEDTAEALREWLAKRPETNHDYVFTSTRGEHNRLSPRAISEVIRRLCATTELPRKLGSHSLRHRVGLTMGREGVPPRVTQHYLGHSSIRTTLEYYQDVDDIDLRRAGRLASPTQKDDEEPETTKNPATE